CRVADTCRLGNERRRVEALNDQPYPYEHLPQATWKRGNQTQTRPHDFRYHPANKDRVSNEAPDGYPTRNQVCLVEQGVEQQTSYSKSDHANVVGIKVCLNGQRAQCLQEDSVGGHCF